MAGPEALAGKKAKKFGDCQWVIPGMTISSMSDSHFSTPSPPAGGRGGSFARTSPGRAGESTG